MTKDFAQPIRKQHRTPESTPSPKKPRSLFYLAGASLILLMLALLSGQNDSPPSQAHQEWLKATRFTSPTQQHDTTTRQQLRLHAGDSTLGILKQLGFSYQQVMDMQAASRQVYSLTHVQAGHIFTRQGEHDVWYDIDASQRLHLQYRQHAWHANIENIPVWHEQRYAEVTIENSLFLDASRAGIDSRTIMNLVDIFAWDIDFARELRKGDRFWILYDVQENEQGKQTGSTILAAEFINQGRVYSAMRYTLNNGQQHYYSFDGHSLRKTYLKAPVKFSRISSRFSVARKHPVLGYTRAHKGVDYAAPRGTPIHAVGDGRITFAGWKGGYGRLVSIRHTNRNHSTRYGHMSRFGKGIRRGVWVKQGQVIGYVGKSGLATGYHLHFEFRVRGRAVNPLSVKHTPAKPVPRAELAAFKEAVRQIKITIQHAAEHQRWG